MFKLKVRLIGLMGDGTLPTNSYQMQLSPANVLDTSNKVFCGTFTSYAAAKTQAAAIFKASLTWDDATMTSAVFTA